MQSASTCACIEHAVIQKLLAMRHVIQRVPASRRVRIRLTRGHQQQQCHATNVRDAWRAQSHLLSLGFAEDTTLECGKHCNVFGIKNGVIHQGEVACSSVDVRD